MSEDLEGLTPEGLIALERRYGEDAVSEATIAYLCSRKRWHGGRFALEVKCRARNARRSEAARKAREDRWAVDYYQ